MSISKSQITKARKILDVYLDGYFAKWFKPSERDMTYTAECLLQDIQRFNGSEGVAEFLASGQVGDWGDALDEILNEIFLDNPEDECNAEWY